jgi:hypothetical protein
MGPKKQRARSWRNLSLARWIIRSAVRTRHVRIAARRGLKEAWNKGAPAHNEPALAGGGGVVVNAQVVRCSGFGPSMTGFKAWASHAGQIGNGSSPRAP